LSATDLPPPAASLLSPDPQRPWPETPAVAGARGIARRLRETGHQAFFVGGCVRNWLLGAPMKDIDLATSARPEQVDALFEQTKTVGAHFGVSLVVIDELAFEVATFRSEGSYVDRRRPSEVRFGTLEEDWPRRDFTVNAMYYDPIDGRLFDPAGGLEDLRLRRLRTVGPPERRFEEDALRLMRAVRFAVRYGLMIEPATADATRAHAAGLAEISIERIAEELLLILTGPRPGEAMRLLDGLDLWPYVIPEIPPMKGCLQPENFHPEGDVFVHTALVLDHLADAWPTQTEECSGSAPGNSTDGPPPSLALAALLHDVGKPPTFTDGPDRIRFPEHQRVGAEMASAICRRLRLPLRLGERVSDLVGQHMRFMDAHRMKRSTLRRFLGQPDFDLHLALHKADCLGSHGKLDNYAFCRERIKTLAAEDRTASLLPDPLIGGEDLIALGMPPGPPMGTLLAEIRERQLEGELQTPEAALTLARERLKKE
jgi:poly(A) polymerase